MDAKEKIRELTGGAYLIHTDAELGDYCIPYLKSTPDRIRTCDRPLRRRMLYPAELRVHREGDKEQLNSRAHNGWLLLIILLH